MSTKKDYKDRAGLAPWIEVAHIDYEALKRAEERKGLIELVLSGAVLALSVGIVVVVISAAI